MNLVNTYHNLTHTELVKVASVQGHALDFILKRINEIAVLGAHDNECKYHIEKIGCDCYKSVLPKIARELMIWRVVEESQREQNK